MTPNVGQAVKDAKGGAIEFRVEKAGIVHAGVGKACFTDDALVANVRALVDALNRAKPSGRQGHLRQAHLAQLDHGPRREGRPPVADRVSAQAIELSERRAGAARLFHFQTPQFPAFGR